MSLVKDNRVICDFRYITDEEMSGIFQISDAVVLPYENTSINSGIMINAFSNGTTVIGTNIEMLQDYSSNLVYGYSFNSREEHLSSLANAFLDFERDYKLGSTACKRVELENITNTCNTWSEVSRVLLNVLQKECTRE